MEQSKGHRGRRQSESTCPLPMDLTSEILLRLPEKSVARFRCVSKLWLSISTDPYFIDLFETRSPPPSLLVCFRKDGNLSVSSIRQHTRSLHQDLKNSYSSSLPIHNSYLMEFPGEISNFTPTESVRGLICFQEAEKLVVWNPSKKQLLSLPKPSQSWKALSVFLGYDQVQGKHKVMCMPLDIFTDVCRVLTLGSAQESWRTVKNHNTHCTTTSRGRCIKGVIYYIANDYDSSQVIMSFDVRSEKTEMIKLPSNIYMKRLITYEGRLFCVDKFCDRILWSLEDAEKHKWSSSQVLSSSPFFYPDFKLIGSTHAGEFVYAPDEFHTSAYFIFYDPVRNSCRRFDFQGITIVYAFLNHIATQISS